MIRQDHGKNRLRERLRCMSTRSRDNRKPVQLVCKIHGEKRQSFNATRVCCKTYYNRVQERMIFMSVYNDFFWLEPPITTFVETCEACRRVTWNLEPVRTEVCNKLSGKWKSIAENTMLEFAESGTAVFRWSSPWSRGVIIRKGKGIVSLLNNAEPNSAEIIVLVKELSIYRAVLTW